MKRIAQLMILLLCSALVSSYASEPIRWGVVGGANVSKATGGIANKNRIGFHLGGKAELSIIDNFYLEGSLLFTQKGYKSDNVIAPNSKGQDKVVYTNSQNNYLELPIHIGYKFELSRDFLILVSGGGYTAVGLFGKNNYEFDGNKSSQDLYKDGRKDRRFDCGLGMKVGAEIFQGLQIAGGYDFGLLGTAKKGGKSRNRNAMISCAYMF